MKRRDFIASIVAATAAPASVIAAPTAVRLSNFDIDSWSVFEEEVSCVEGEGPKTPFFHDLDICSSYYYYNTAPRLNLEGLGYA